MGLHGRNAGPEEGGATAGKVGTDARATAMVNFTIDEGQDCVDSGCGGGIRDLEALGAHSARWKEAGGSEEDLSHVADAK